MVEKTTDNYLQLVSDFSELHKRLQRIQSQMLEKYDISLLEYHILVILYKVNNISQNDLASQLSVDKALISRLIPSLESKHLISTAYDPNCRRKKVVTLSKEALELIPKLEKAHKNCLDKIFSDMNQEDIKSVQTILEGLIRKL